MRILLINRFNFFTNICLKKISSLNRNDDLEIDVCDFISFLDLSRPSCPAIPVNVMRDVCPEMPFTQSGRLIDWEAFLKELGLEEELKHAAD